MNYTLKPEMIELFFEFINERHLIYLKRQRGEKWPWTNDKVLQTYRFCNIFRELDIGTIWYRENWREPYADHEKLFFNTVLYRAFNYWPTAEYLGYMLDSTGGTGLKGTWNADEVEADLRYRAEDGHKIFTSAHMLTGTLGGPERKDKIWQVVHAVCDHMWKNEQDYIPRKGDTLQKAFQRLKEAPGHGPFIAYEVITDLRHTRYLKDAKDIMTWANPGPGAMRGINRICGLAVGKEDNTLLLKPKHYPVKRSGLDYLEKMRELLKTSYESDYKADYVPSMEMRDIEHSLCEFDKYMRVVTGQGRPRQKFVPPHER